MSAFGAESVTLTLYRYRPSTIRGLALLLKADALEENKRSYIMYGLRSILAYQSQGKSRFPTYAEYVKELMQSAQPKDKRTAKTIKDNLLKKLERIANG